MRTKRQAELFCVPKKEPRIKVAKKYVSKIKAPIYEPKGRAPHILKLVDMNKYSRLLQSIRTSKVSGLEKEFLRLAATRHLVFLFDKIADYYAHATTEMQEMMEESALVIIDFDKAIENGYVRLSEEIAEQFIEDTANGD